MAALFRSQAINLHVTLDLLCSTYAWTEYNLCDQICTAFSVQQEQDAFQARQLPSFLSLVFHVRHYFLFEADTLYALLNIDCCSPQLAGINAAIKKRERKSGLWKRLLCHLHLNIGCKICKGSSDDGILSLKITGLDSFLFRFKTWAPTVQSYLQWILKIKVGALGVMS